MARTSVVPDIIDGLVYVATAALPAARVIDGYDLSEDPSDMFMVGVDDPSSPTWANVATSQAKWANATKQGRDESGEVTCAAISFNGNSDQQQARNTVYAMVNAVADAVRANHTLASGTYPNGIPGVWETNVGASSKLTQILNDDGAVALLVVTVDFKARI